MNKNVSSLEFLREIVMLSFMFMEVNFSSHVGYYNVDK